MMSRTHLLPFLWLRGEGEEAIRRGVEDIAASGCGSVCAESRTHPDYLGEGWWRDVDVLCDACRRRGMTFYLLDDTHFPSGYANGAAGGTPYARMMMTEQHMDVVGPRRGGVVLARADGEKGALVAVVAGRRAQSLLREEFVDLGGWAVDRLIDLTEQVEDGLVRWDVPEGTWRVFVLTARAVSERNPPQVFVNPLLPQGGQLMIDTVYEPHFAHMSAEFGKTFRGFFSDEPALRAGRGCKAVPGEYPQLPIPWRMDMPELLSAQLGRDARVLLPGLWFDIGADTPRIRYALMDTVSRLYGENYSMPIGDWCRAHGVEYIGHVIEQNNAHSRLGQGAGHFFRAMSGQDMAGMDYVLHELKPEFRDTTHAWKSQDFEADDDFFRYMLPQMTVSCARLDPKKRGRSLCEIFGGYGWQEDAAEMRYMANLLLSRGVNHFTPHAFSLKPFPDEDSPPHFGAFNPLMPAIASLFAHMERCAGELDGGEISCRVGALYYAEAEWACGKDCMKTQAIVKALNRRQIFCEIVPIDALTPGRYDVLLIPCGRLWPRKLFDRLDALRAAGCRVVFVGGLPEGISEGTGELPAWLADCEAIALEEIADTTRSAVRLPVEPLGEYPQVHCTPYEKAGQLTLALFNEDDREMTEFRFRMAMQAPVLYDSEAEQCHALERDGDGWRVELTPGQLLLVGPWREGWPAVHVPEALTARKPLRPVWQITYLDGRIPAVKSATPGEEIARHPRYSGRIRCCAEVTLPKGCAALELAQAHGAMRLTLDGRKLGLRVAAPYRYALEAPANEAFANQTHRLEVEVLSPLFFAHRDELSFFNYIQPVGLSGAVIPYARGEARDPRCP